MSSRTVQQAAVDPKTHAVVAIRNSDGTVQNPYSNLPVVDKIDGVWRPLRVMLPEGYLPDFQHLLGNNVAYVFDPDEEIVYRTYPDADFSVEAVKNSKREMANTAAKQYFDRTDWYYIRNMETGKKIPDDVAAERKRIRKRLDEIQNEIEALSEDEVLDYQVSIAPVQETVGGEQPEEVKEEPEGGVAVGGDSRPWITDASSPKEQGNPVRHASNDEVANDND